MKDAEIKEDDILDLIISRVHDDPAHDAEIAFRTTDRNRSIETLREYFIKSVKQDHVPGILLLEIFVSVVEGIKAHFPDIDASVRKMNIEHLKKINNAPNQ